MLGISLVILGETLNRIPQSIKVVSSMHSSPDPQSLYEARLNAVLSVSTPYVTLVDGGEDELLPEYEDSMLELCSIMNKMNTNIGSCLFEIGNTGKTAYLRHAVLMRTSVLHNIEWPKGLYRFESVVYEKLSLESVATLHPKVVYRWNATPGGVHTWPDMPAARVNSWRWLYGKTPLPESRPPSRRPKSL